MLVSWSLSIVTSDEIKSQFSIDLTFLGGLTPSQRSVFDTASERWSEIIIGDLPPASIGRNTIDDLLIEARGLSIDGPGGVLGQAGPTHVRADSRLPVKGIMEFDLGDLLRMETDGSLLNVIIHEMGHVLGIGSLWGTMGLLLDAGTANPIYAGMKGMREFGQLAGTTGPRPVPVANTGGSGTRDSHWRETVFGSELMTGYFDPSVNPVSRLTVACLDDMGYAVNYQAADPYVLPRALDLAIIGVGTRSGYGRRECAMSGCPGSLVAPIPVPVD